MVVKSLIDVVNLAFDPVQYLQVFAMLLGVPLIEPFHQNHDRPSDHSDDNRNPPHRSHPTVPDRLSINPSGLCLSDLLLLAFLNGRPMEVFLAMAKAQSDAPDMALKAHSPPTWHHVEGEKIAAFCTVDRTHHY